VRFIDALEQLWPDVLPDAHND